MTRREGLSALSHSNFPVALRCLIRQKLPVIILVTLINTGISWGHQDEPPALKNSPANAEIERLNQKLEKGPDSLPLNTRLAKAYILKGRDEGGHVSFDKAEKILEAVLKKAPDNKEALYLRAWDAMFQHHFTDAETWAKKGIKYYPNTSYFYGILSDSNLERGNLSNAVAFAQKMLDLKPDQGAYSRAAHLRSITRDSEGAIELWQMAIRAASTDKVDNAWCQVELGNEYLNKDSVDKAELAYRAALVLVPGYPKAEAGLTKARKVTHDRLIVGSKTK